MRHVMLAWVLVVTLIAGSSRASGDIVVMQHDGPAYGVAEGSNSWLLARQRVAQRFYETHGDAYDFLVVLPTFTASLGKDADGLHVAVSNEVRGIGKPLSPEGGAPFGSPGRLKGYIDMRALMSGVPSSTQWGAVVLAHEVAHQWSGQAGFKETPSGHRSDALLGKDSAHWSFFLNSEASVLYGSNWEARGPASFESVERQRRYSALDLYLMGFLSPQEVGPLTLLSPTPQEPSSAESIPPPDGTRISATSRLLGIQNIIDAEGPRLPDTGSSQKHFRAAFIVLTAPGQSATPAQLAYAESLRHDFENHFFFLTRGRGVFETDLVELPPGPVAGSPGVEPGLAYLLSRQSPAGHWGTTPEASLRETQQAMEALRLFLSSEGVSASLQLAQSSLQTREPIEVDGLARLSLATQGTNAAALARLSAWLLPSGSVGLSPGYRSTLLDTALVGLALTAPPGVPDSTPAVTRFLLEHQSLDGGWPALPGGPSRFEPTALALEYLARVPRTPAITAAANRAFTFFRNHRDSRGLFVDEGSRAAATGWALTSLALWRQLTATEALSAKEALLGRQLQDGSWEGSVVDTALALRALRIVLTPNLAVSPAGVQLSATQVTAGETVLATVRVSNTGYVEARNVLVQGFDSSGQPLGLGVQLESIAAGDTVPVLLSLDTRNAGGSSQAFFVVDPAGALDEGQESDNRAAVPLFVSEAPTAPDLFVQAGGVAVTPAAIDRLPAQVVVSARVGNLGKTSAPPAEVVVRMGTQVLATSQLTLGAQSSQLATWTLQLATVQAAGVLTVEVDPSNTVPEPVETNNSRTVQLMLNPGVDLRVTALTAPATVEQGHDLTFQYTLTNGGTIEAMSSGWLEIVSGSGAPIATLPLASQLLRAGGSATGQLMWRANTAGPLRAVLRTQHPDDLDPSNDTATALFEVQPSSLPNLMVVTGSLSIAPEPPLETQSADVGVTVRNSGQSEAQGFTVELYLGMPEAGGTRFHREQVAALAPGATLHITGTVMLPQEAPKSLHVVLDGAQAVSEFDEEDNRTFLTLSPVPIADLVVSAADIRPDPAFPRENTSVPVTVSVLNAGGQRAELVPVELRLVSSNGSEALIGQAVLPSIEPGQRGELVLTWNTTGLRGPQKLAVLVNPGQTVPEQRTNNNRAERQVSVQDAALALSEPYFSPNGDGIRDVTEISYRLAAEAPVEARIEDAQGKQVRILTAPTAAAASLSWDGRSTEGRLVPDGMYRIHVRTLAPALEALLGTLTAVVDTNRTPLDSSAPSSLEVEGLEGTASADYYRYGPAAAMPDESGVVFYGEEPGNGRCGLYHQRLGGSPARRLTSDGWPCDAYSDDSGGLVISPDASRIAFHGTMTCPQSTSLCWTLEILSTADHSLLRVAMDEKAQGRYLRYQVAPVFSRDGSRVYFVVEDQSVHDFTLEEVRVDGTQRSTLARSHFEPVELSLSPEGERLAVVDDTGALFFIQLADGSRQDFLPAQTISEGFYLGVGGIQANLSLDLRHGWMPSGESLVYASPGLLELVFEGDEPILLPIAPSLERKEWRTGAIQKHFVGPRYSLDFNQSVAAVAVHPITGGTVFRHQPLLSTSPQLWTVSPAGVARMLLPYDVQGLRWSPGGSFLFGFTDAGTSGGSRLRAITTRDNLFVRLMATRTPGSAAVSFQGTAADLNFEEWQLGVRAYGSSGPFAVVSTSTTPVQNGLLTEWIPPGPGMYEAQLLARDRAGNVRTQTVAFGYSLSPAVANVSRIPDLFSPNGDGVLDTTQLRYTVTRTTIADFQILDANNQVVLQQPLPHPAAGNFSISWDGRNAQGQRVPDGEYTLSIDGIRLAVVIDTTPPVAQLSLSETGSASLPAPYQALNVLPQDLTSEGLPTTSLVRIITAGTTWKIQDAHLKEWAFEISSPQDPSVSRPVYTGTEPVDADRPIAVELLRGSFRLRVQDRAGNQALTPPLRLDDRLFVTFGGRSDSLHEYWLLPGQLMPRVASFTNAQATPDGIASIPRIADGKYAFGLNTTSGTALTSFSVAYRTGTGPWIIDSQNVTALGDAMVLWDAASAGGVTELELRARDAEGTLFTAPVVLRSTGTGGGSESHRMACVKTRGGEAIVLSAFVGDRNTRSEDLAPGARWSFTREDTLAVTTVPAEPVLRSTSGGLEVSQTLATPSLPGCQYTVQFEGTHRNGTSLSSAVEAVDLCKAQVTVSQRGISLTESFRQAIRSTEVFVNHLGQERVVARFEPFEGSSGYHPIDRSLFPDAPLHTLRARTRLVDGTVVLTEPNLEAGHPDLLDPDCNDEAKFQPPQGSLQLSRVVRDADAPLCGIHAPVYTTQLTGTAGEGQSLQHLRVELVSANGVVVSQPTVSGAEAGDTVVNAWVHINAQALPEGDYWLRASATWSDGSNSSATEQPLFIDRTPAHTVMTRPGSTGKLCPESRRGSNGVIEQYLVVEGTVADRHLEAYELFLRGPGGEPQSVLVKQFDPTLPSSVQGVLGTVNITQEGSSFELVLSARDVSGSSWCATPIPVQVATPPALGELSLSHAIFSPDADGSFDTTNLRFSVDQDVSATLTVQAGTQTHTIFQGPVPQGNVSLPWSGLLEGGARLADGAYPLRVRVTGACGMTAEASTLVRLDTKAPVARVDFPIEGQTLASSFTVTGEATDENLVRYELSLGEGAAPTQYTSILSATASSSGVLGMVPLASLPLGEYTLRLVVEDSVGHVQQVLRRFQHQPAALLQATAVVPGLVSPDGDGASDTATLSVTLAAPATVSAALLDGSGQPLRTLVEPTSLPAQTSQLPITGARLTGLPDGVYTVRVTADSGSAMEDALASLAIDLSMPRVLLSSPVAGGTRGAELTVEGVLEDAHLESWTLTHVAPGEGGSGHLLASGSTSTSGILAVRSGLTEGTHQLVLTALDRAGHSQEQSVSFTVDATPPVVSFLSPTAGAVLSGAVAPLELRGHAEDAHLRSVRLEATTTQGTETLFLGASLPADGLIHLWPVAYDADGPAELRLVAEDDAGNAAESLISIVLDSTPPVAALTEPHGTTGGEGLAFRGTATDARLSTWELELGRGTSASTTEFQRIATSSQPSSSGVLTTLASVGDGAYVARLRVRDSAGNESVDEAAFTVDSIAPLPTPALSATVERPNTVVLTWSPSPSSDVAAYEVHRTTQAGASALIATLAGEARTYTDTGLPDGRFRYFLVARDAAQNASHPSPEALVEIDGTPPMAQWLAPLPYESVRGTFELQGTAYSQSDFREYRVSIGSGAVPSAFTLLERSLLPVSNGRLGELNVLPLPQGSVQTLRLEAEDLIGNVSESRVTFTVDNLPPTAPVLDTATATGTTLTLQWHVTPEEDVLGYVPFRDGAPLGTPSNASPQDLRPYALPATSRSYSDTGVPDGQHSYHLVSIDRAGNVSVPSNSLQAVIETRAPAVRLTEPHLLERVRHDAWLVAQGEDQDITSVQFEGRAGPSASFSSVGAAATRIPFTSRLPLSQFSGKVLELRAIAKDSSNKVDPSPASIHVLKEAIPSQPLATALVDGDQVQLSWTDANPTGLLTGFELSEAGVLLTPAPERWPGTASATSTASGSPASAYDGDPSTTWGSGSGFPQSWTLTLDHPALLRALTIGTRSSSQVQLGARIAGFWVTISPTLQTQRFSELTHSLESPVEVEAVRVTFLSTSLDTPALSEVLLDAVPLEHGTSTLLSSVTPGLHTYRLRSMGFGGTPSEPAELSVHVYAPQLEAAQAETPESTIALQGREVPPSAQVELFNEEGVIATTTADPQGYFGFTASVMRGLNTFQARATDGAGNHSLPSEPVTVVGAPAPAAALTLAPGGVTGADVSLSLSVSGDTTDVAGYVLVREGQDGTVELPPASAGTRSFIDRGLRNGSYTYRAHAFNAYGFRGPASNEVTATVDIAPPASPVEVSVEPLPSGGALEVSWAPGDARTVAYRVERAVGAEGPFEVLAGSERVLTTQLVDLPLSDDTSYRYRILALDALGNLSSPSVIVTGVPVDSTPPAPPRFLRPTVAGKPVTVTSPTVSLTGLTEPGTQVTLLRHGVPHAEAPAGALGVEALPLDLSLAAKGQGWSSADGQRVAYVVQDSATGAKALAVESRAGELLGTFSSPAFFSITEAVFSPDGQRVALQVLMASTFQSAVYVAELGTGELRRPASAPQGSESSPTWSSNSRELAYEVTRTNLPISIAVVDTVTGSTQWLNGEAGAPLMAPRYAREGSSLFALTRSGAATRLLRMDPVSGASSPLFEATSIERDYAVSPDTGRLALVATREGLKDLYVVSVSTGASVRLTQGAEPESLPAFSWDGRRLAFASGSMLVLHEDGRQQRFSGFSGLRLSWSQAGELLASRLLGLARLEWGARFEFTGVRLEPGSTVFSATAMDAAQRTGLPAAPIQVTLDATTLPDLVAEVQLRPEVPQMGHPFDAFVTVRNQGGGAAPATTLSVSVLSPDGTSIVPKPISLPAIASGGMTTAVVPLSHPTLHGPQLLEVIVDPEQRVNDPVRDNNRVRYPFSLASDDQPVVAVSVSPPSVNADAESLATITVANPGASRNVDVEVQLVTPNGEPVFQVGAVEHLAPLEAGRSRTFTRTVSVGRTMAGPYQVKAVVREGAEVLTELGVPLTINADRTTYLRLATSRASYFPGEVIALTATVRNDSTNSFLEGASCLLTVTDPAGNTVLETPVALPLLAQGASYSARTELPSLGLPPGQYEAQGRIQLGSRQLATVSTHFSIVGRPLIAGAISVLGEGTPPVVRAGHPLAVDFEAANQGTAPEPSLALRVALIDVDTMLTVATYALPVQALEVGASLSGQHEFSTAGLPLKGYAAYLLAEKPDGTAQVLSSASLQLMDGQAPVLEPLNFSEGMVVRSLWPSVRAADSESGVATLHVASTGEPGSAVMALTSGTAFDGAWVTQLSFPEGPNTLSFVATDLAGNTSQLSVTVFIDSEPPQVNVTGVTDGALFGSAPVPIVEAVDEHLASVSLFLDGQPFTSGAPVATDGQHELMVQAADRAGNQTLKTLRFTVDMTAPWISISGVAEGGFFRQSVTPVVTIRDRDLRESTITLDGQPFLPGAVVTVEGVHTLQAQAMDRAGNQTERQVTFTLDQTPPAVTISGVADGTEYSDTVTPVIDVQDTHLATSQVRLNGAPFVSGTSLDTEGSYTLTVRAEDLAGWVTERTVQFSILPEQVIVSHDTTARFPRVLALIRSGLCTASASEVQRVGSFLQQHLGGNTQFLQVVTSEEGFLETLRSGVANVVVFVSLNSTGAECSEELSSPEPTPDDPPAVKARKAWSRELTEQLFSGHTGLVVIRPRPEGLSLLGDTLGVNFAGTTQHSMVLFPSSPVSSEAFYLSSPTGGSFLYSVLEPSDPNVAYYSDSNGLSAGLLHTLGQGRAVTLGIDLSSALPAAQAGNALSSSVSYVEPLPPEPAPLGVAAVELSMTSQAQPLVVRAEETLPSALQALWTHRDGSILGGGHGIVWSELPLEHQVRLGARFLLRLPENPGSHTSTASLTDDPASPAQLGIWQWDISQPLTPAQLLARARTASAEMGNEARALLILKSLDRVETRVITERTDIDANIADLLDAAVMTQPMGGTSIPVRKALDDLIQYWEARWFLF